jgi:hemerythrin-like domain-containing protein
MSTQDILAVLDSDHRAIEELIEQARAETDPEKLAALCEQLVMDVVRHLVGEEQYLLPLVRENLGDGDEHSKAAFAEHQAIEHQLKRLEDLERDRTAVLPVLDETAELLGRHMARQDDALFTALRSAVPAEELDRLGDEVIGAEQLAPTRPRDLRPESPALNKVVSLVSGWVDHVRDSYSHRGVEPGSDALRD